MYLYTSGKGLTSLKKAGITYSIEKEVFNFPNAELTPQFLNPKTRKDALEPYYICKSRKTTIKKGQSIDCPFYFSRIELLYNIHFFY